MRVAVQNPTGINLTSTLDALGSRLVLQDNYGTTSYAWDQQFRLTGILNPYNEQTTMLYDELDREYHRVLATGGTFEVVAASCSLNHASVFYARRCAAPPSSPVIYISIRAGNGFSASVTFDWRRGSPDTNARNFDAFFRTPAARCLEPAWG